MRSVTAFSVLALAASVLAQTPPKVQLALLVDSSGAGGRGAIHRIDTRTGKYLGYFGQGTLNYPGAIAVQPGTNVVFVDDSQSLKKVDMSTGRYLGLVARNTALGGPASSMRFGPDGTLYAAVNTDFEHYQVVKINPTTGAVLKSPAYPTDYLTKISVGFRPDGRVSVFESSGGGLYEDAFFSDTLLPAGRFFMSGANDLAAYRTSNDVFLRLRPNGIVRSGFGDLANGSVAGSGGTKSPMFAEGAMNQTYLFGDINGTLAFLVFDTYGVGFSAGGFYPAPFAHGLLVDMAIYAK